MKQWILAALVAVTMTGFASEMLLVTGGRPNAEIILPGEAPYTPVRIFPRDRTQIAAMLSEYIQQATGAELPLAEKTSGNRIELRVEEGNMDIEGFRIEFPDEQGVVITGASMRALEYGVYEFLERFVGVRWLFPGKLGIEIPKTDNLSIPRQNIRMEPSFLRRFLSGGSHTQEPAATFYQWMVNLRGNFHNRLNSTHALWQFVPPEKFAESNPEFYPILNGKRFIPKPGEVLWWQPCLTSPGLVNAVASAIPENSSIVAFSSNDGGRFCECDACLAVDKLRTNYLGFPHRSRSFVAFANAVAKQRPKAILCFGAYTDLAEPPENLVLEANLIPSITCDSFQWLDPARRKAFQDAVRKWDQVTPSPISWYDYIYGHGYALPRYYGLTLASNVKWLYENNVRYFSAEYYPDGDWQDAPKAYILLKLLWNVNEDPEALLDDWCRSAVGAAAGSQLKAYFTLLEEFWTSAEVRQTAWFGTKPRTYLDWTDPSFIEALPEDTLNQCEKLLEKVVELSKNKARAKYFYDAFIKNKAKILVAKENISLLSGSGGLIFDRQVSAENFNTPGKIWGSWQSPGAKGTFSRDETGGIDATPAILIDADAANWLSMCFMHYVQSIPGKTYHISVKWRHENLDQKAILNLSARWQKNGRWMNNVYNSKQSQAVPGSSDQWQTTELLVASPQELDVRLVILLGIDQTNSGKIWFDDAKVKMASWTAKERMEWTAMKAVSTAFSENFNRAEIRWESTGTQENFLRDEEAGINASPALRIIGTKGAFVNFIPVPSGVKYRFSGWYRGSALTVTLKWQNSTPAWLSEEYSVASDFPASEQWTEFCLYANAPSEEGLRIVPMLSLADPKKSDSVILDDLKCEILEMIKE